MQLSTLIPIPLWAILVVAFLFLGLTFTGFCLILALFSKRQVEADLPKQRYWHGRKALALGPVHSIGAGEREFLEERPLPKHAAWIPPSEDPYLMSSPPPDDLEVPPLR